jgi:hypothetical protein
MAHSLTICFHVINVLNREPAEKEVKGVLGIPEHLKVAFGFRLVYALPSATRQVRVCRDLKDFTHHHRFGNPLLE